MSMMFMKVLLHQNSCHIGDLAKGNIKAIDKDMLMSKYRANLEWNKMFELAIDKKRAAEKFKENPLSTCSMCGKLCAIKLSKN